MGLVQGCVRSVDRDLESVLQAHLGLRCDAPDSTFQGSSSMHSSCARFSTHSQMVMDGRQLAPPNLCGSNHDHGALLDLSACRSPAAGTRLVKKTLQHQTLASSTTSAWSQKTIFSTWHRVPTSLLILEVCVCRLGMRPSCSQ